MIAMLTIEDELVPGAFTASRLTALELLASQAAISLENARLLRRNQEARRESQFLADASELLAESLGKDGTGLVPVVGEPLGPPEVYGDDRLFLVADAESPAATALRAAGHPVLHLPATADLNSLTVTADGVDVAIETWVDHDGTEISHRAWRERIAPPY